MSGFEWGLTAEIVARATGARPVWSIEASTELGLSAARWQLESLPPIGGTLPLGILGYRAAGSAWATKAVDGHTIRRRPRVGSVSFVPSNGRATWAVDGPFEAVHVYLHPGTVQRVAERELDLAGASEIDDFFAIEDPWLAGYFRMLITELELRNPVDRRADPLLLDESEHLLVRHLLRWHGRGGVPESRLLGQARANPLRPALMRRAEEYIQANLGGEISLASLARLSCMSVDHFLRSFRAACGLTPYQHVLEQRLRKAAAMLRTGNTPIAEIAMQCGFRNPSHFSVKFHARFGVSPSQFRRTT
jgi:AraC family transcriptional regulator